MWARCRPATVILEWTSIARSFGDPALKAPKAQYRVCDAFYAGSPVVARVAHSAEDDGSVTHHVQLFLWAFFERDKLPVLGIRNIEF